MVSALDTEIAAYVLTCPVAGIDLLAPPIDPIRQRRAISACVALELVDGHVLNIVLGG